MTNEIPQPCGLPILEAELAETLQAIKESFEVTRAVNSRADEFGYRRSSAVKDAVTLLKVSAEIGVAIAKIKGEYNHNINVLHGEIWPPPRRAVAKPQTPEEGRPAPRSLGEGGPAAKQG